jgi:integrase
MAKPKPRKETYGKFIFRRTRNGVEQIFARVGYYDENGKWKYKYERATDEDDAILKAEKILKNQAKHGTAFIDGTRMNFEELADFYIKNYAIPPTYEEGQQVAGLRSYRNVRLQAERLKKEFGKVNIHRITPELLTRFKNKRKNIDKVTTATINRDLELINTMFKKAVIRRWIEESPFVRAENLIRKSLEARRKMTVTPREEKLILDAAKTLGNKYLYPLVLILRDSGARPSEIFPYSAYGVNLDKLPAKIQEWTENGITASEQVFFPLCWFHLFQVEFQVVPLVSVKSQQVEFRFGTMTERLRQALLELWETTDKDPIKLVFPFKTIRKEWQKVRDFAALHQVFSELQTIELDKQEDFMKRTFGKKAEKLLPFAGESVETLIAEAEKINAASLLTDVKIRDLRIRDWRRIWTSNAHLAGVPEHIAQRILGHKQLKTTFHYTEADLRAVVEMSKTLDEHQVSIAIN